MQDLWTLHRQAVIERDRTPLSDLALYSRRAARVAELYTLAKEGER